MTKPIRILPPGSNLTKDQALGLLASKPGTFRPPAWELEPHALTLGLCPWHKYHQLPVLLLADCLFLIISIFPSFQSDI